MARDDTPNPKIAKRKPGPILLFEGTTSIPYRTIDGPPEADRLVVTFPRVRRSAAPTAKLASVLQPSDGHVLLLGSDDQMYLGPDRQHRGIEAAKELIAFEAERRGLPLQAVVTTGISWGASIALWVGLELGVGRIIAGGAAIYLGQVLKGWDVPREGVKSKSDWIRSLISQDGDDGIAWLDDVIFEAARGCTAPVHVDLFGSPDDIYMHDMRRLNEALAAHPTVRSSLFESSYGRHAEVFSVFPAFLHDRLAATRSVG
jgi:hypothetical protein